MIVYEGYQIKQSKQMPTLYVIVTDGKGGKIPDVLSGMFTSTPIAKQEIDNYLLTKPKPKGRENAGQDGAEG